MERLKHDNLTMLCAIRLNVGAHYKFFSYSYSYSEIKRYKVTTKFAFWYTSRLFAKYLITLSNC